MKNPSPTSFPFSRTGKLTLNQQHRCARIDEKLLFVSLLTHERSELKIAFYVLVHLCTIISEIAAEYNIIITL